MMTSSRIQLLAGLAILGGCTIADAQTQPAPGARPASTPTQPPAGARPASTPTRAAAPAVATSGTGAVHGAASASYNRTTPTGRRRLASATPSGGAPSGMGAYADNDPFRPYSAQARRSTGISPTRLSEAPPPPPRMEPQARYNYYPGLRGGQHPNANVPQPRHHCTPSRGSVLAGSMGYGR